MTARRNAPDGASDAGADVAVNSVVVEADGGSRGNPGPAGYGALVCSADTGELLAERADSVGIATNNVAEYSGLIAGLEAALELGARTVSVRMDSKLVVEQMSGRWRIKHPDMKPLAARAQLVVDEFDSVEFSWIPRSKNSAADALANSAMDGKPVHRNFVPDPAESDPAESDAGESDAGAGDTDADAETRDLLAAVGVSASGWAEPVSGTAVATVLVRHGASVLSPQRRFSGRGDVPLSPDGRWQAEQLAARLASRGGVDRVISSPLRRSRRTAESIANQCGISVEIDDDLIETDFGAWEGLTYAEVEQKWPDELVDWRDSTAVAPPGGESFDDTEVRVRRALGRIRADTGSRIAVVTHVTPVKVLLRLALGAGEDFFHRLRLSTAGMSEVDWNADGSALVHTVNDTAHLEVR